jgi:hypothetical protein
MGSDRPRNRDALPLSSGEFVRVAVEERAREIDAVEEFSHAIQIDDPVHCLTHHG